MTAPTEVEIRAIVTDALEPIALFDVVARLEVASAADLVWRDGELPDEMLYAYGAIFEEEERRRHAELWAAMKPVLVDMATAANVRWLHERPELVTAS